MATQSTLSDVGDQALRFSLAASKPSDRLYVVMGLLMIAIVATAFSSGYFGRTFTDAPPLPLFVHVHALLFTGWILLFTAQATLAQRGRYRYHRNLGIGSMLLAVIIVFVGAYSAIQGARRGHNPGGAPNALAFMIIPWVDIVLFGGFVSAAWHFRKQPELHKRLIMFGTLGGFLAPAITRLPFLPDGPQRPISMFAILLTIVLIPTIASWFTRRQVHWLDWASATVIVASVPLRVWIGTTDTWQRFAAWTVS